MNNANLAAPGINGNSNISNYNSNNNNKHSNRGSSSSAANNNLTDF